MVLHTIIWICDCIIVVYGWDTNKQVYLHITVWQTHPLNPKIASLATREDGSEVICEIIEKKVAWYSCIIFVQCWTNVEDVGPTLYKYYTNVLCLLGWHLTKWYHEIYHRILSEIHNKWVVCHSGIDPCPARSIYIYKVSSIFWINRKMTKFDKTVFVICSVNPIIQYWEFVETQIRV